MDMEIKIIGLEGIPLIKKGDDLSQLILKAMVLVVMVVP